LKTGYTFNDILLVPRVGELDSRSQVNTFNFLWDTEGTGLFVGLPVILSPMDSIVNVTFLYKFIRLGGFGYLPRFYTDLGERFQDVQLLENEGLPYGIAVGLDEEHFWKPALEVFENLVAVCVDVANGYLPKVAEEVIKIRRFSREINKPISIIAGNVVTPDGVKRLYDAGATGVRVGLGSGAVCTTRNMTGVGYPQLSAVRNCYESMNVKGFNIISDGGVTQVGDIVKAISAGADFVMAGSFFARASDCPANGKIYGMASHRLQKKMYGKSSYAEGMDLGISRNGTLGQIMNEISMGIKSAGTYLNAKTIPDFREVDWVECSESNIKKL